MVMPLRPVEPRASRHEFHLGREQRRPTHSSRRRSSSMVVRGREIRAESAHTGGGPRTRIWLGTDSRRLRARACTILCLAPWTYRSAPRHEPLSDPAHRASEDQSKKSAVRFQAEANHAGTEATQITGRGPGGGRRVCGSALTPSCAFCDGSSRSTSVHAARVMPT